MSDIWCQIASEVTLTVTKAQFRELEKIIAQASKDTDEEIFEFDLEELCDNQLFIFCDYSDGDFLKTPKPVLLYIGGLIDKNGMDYLQFGVSYSTDKVKPGSCGGTTFRILRDGSILETPSFEVREALAELVQFCEDNFVGEGSGPDLVRAKELLT